MFSLKGCIIYGMKLLEIGPGEWPVIMQDLPRGGPDVVNEITEYHAIQPEYDCPRYSFPPSLKGVKGVEFHNQSAEYIPYSDDFFDEVLTTNVLSDPSIGRQVIRTIMHEVVRVMRPGALFTTIDFYTAGIEQRHIPSFEKWFSGQLVLENKARCDAWSDDNNGWLDIATRYTVMGKVSGTVASGTVHQFRKQ